MPEQFGKFRLTEQIGGGRLSQVFRAGGQNGARTKVALKRLNPSLIGETNFVSLVVREAGLLASLDHQNLCGCFELGVVDGCVFFTLELVEGCTLRALLRRLSEDRLPLPVSAVLAIGQQLSAVLSYVHDPPHRPYQHGSLVHGDLSPQNILITCDGTIKLIDFGFARYVDGHDPPPLGGRIAGTVGYMSPEQAAGDPNLDQRSDQFGLGILLWEMLCGRRLFRGNTPNTWRRMREGDVPFPSEIMSRQAQFLYAIKQMLAPHPNDRFETMDAVSAALAELANPLRSGATPLGAMVSRLLDDPQFDPFDMASGSNGEKAPTNGIPDGTLRGTNGSNEYAELLIKVDQGIGSPSDRMRSVLPDAPNMPPISPFLETLPDRRITAEAQ